MVVDKCPFCGGPPGRKICYGGGGRPIDADIGEESVQLICCKCGAFGPEVLVTVKATVHSKIRDAIKAWNKR